MDKHINGFLKAHARFFDRRDMLSLLQMPLLALDPKYLYFDAVHFIHPVNINLTKAIRLKNRKQKRRGKGI